MDILFLEDSFLLLDIIEANETEIKKIEPKLCVEIGYIQKFHLIISITFSYICYFFIYVGLDVE